MISIMNSWIPCNLTTIIVLELEINRIFKSETFNTVEHTLHTDYVAKMMNEEREALLGICLRRDKKLNTRSPLMNEVFCHRDIDFRLLSLGVVKYNQWVSILNNYPATVIVW